MSNLKKNAQLTGAVAAISLVAAMIVAITWLAIGAVVGLLGMLILGAFGVSVSFITAWLVASGSLFLAKVILVALR
jgi:hypothetical protein